MTIKDAHRLALIYRFGIMTVAIITIVIVASLKGYDKPLVVNENKPYYLTRDSSGRVWIGDIPGQKQAPLYNENGNQVGEKK